MRVIEQALELAFSGLPVFPCGANKIPAISKKKGGRGFLDASTDEVEVRRLFKLAPHAKLVGVPTGPDSGFDVLDLDYRHGAGVWELENAHRLPETRIHSTQSGGRHMLFKHAPGVRNSESSIAKGVDVRGDGGYVIHPPSLGYVRDSDADIAEWPEWLFKIVLSQQAKDKPEHARPINDAPAVEISEKRLSAFVDSVVRRVKQSGEGNKHPSLRGAARSLGGIQHLASFSDESAVKLLLEALPSGVKDWDNARKTAFWGLEDGKKHPIELEDRPRYTNGHTHAPAEPAAPPTAIDWLPDQEWRDDLARGQNGNPMRTLSNVLLAFRKAAAWRGVFAWNQFSSRLMVMKELPDATTPRKFPRELTEADISNVTDWLQRNGIVVASQTTAEAIRAVAEDNDYHPVRDYLTALKWDRRPRIDLWLTKHLGVTDTPLHRAFSSRWMIGLVARVMDPGCQLDTALILESRQGLRKSTALRILAEPWFTDHVPDLASKDALEQLQGVWIIELAELTSFSKAETHRIKSFLTTRIDRFRPSFGRVPADHPRQCGFAGTINPGSNGYLRDETGARRFWIVACGIGWGAHQQVDDKALRQVKDQLWAEAVHRYNEKEAWWLNDPTLEKGQTLAADARQADDPREPRIRRFVNSKEWVRMDEILGPDCLNVPAERWTINLRTEIGFVMSVMKWTRRRKRTNDGLEWRYYPPNTEVTDDEPE